MENEGISDVTSPLLFPGNLLADEPPEEDRSVSNRRGAVAEFTGAVEDSDGTTYFNDDDMELDSSDTDSGNYEEQLALNFGSLSEGLIRQLFVEVGSVRFLDE